MTITTVKLVTSALDRRSTTVNHTARKSNVYIRQVSRDWSIASAEHQHSSREVQNLKYAVHISPRSTDFDQRSAFVPALSSNNAILGPQVESTLYSITHIDKEIFVHSLVTFFKKADNALTKEPVTDPQLGQKFFERLYFGHV